MPVSNGIAHPNIGIRKPPSQQDYSQRLVRDPFPIIPHASMYAGKWNAVSKTYNVYFDEASATPKKTPWSCGGTA